MTFGISAAVLGAGVIGAGASIYSANQASNAQQQAAQQSAAQQQAMFDKQVALQEPFRQGGMTAQNQLMTLLGLSPGADSGVTVNPNDPNFGKYAKDFSMADYQADPGYAFRMDQGMKALQNSAAAKGLLSSGSTLKGITDYSQGMASQEYGNAYNRYQTNRANQLNPLQSLMGSGQTAANTLTSAAGQLGQGLGQADVAQGNARASGYINSSNALNSALNSGVNSYMNYNMMNRSPLINGVGGLY
jgi:type II secretory pathway pseudopilin PulG